MNLVDVHCHLIHKEFADDLDEVISRSKKADVKRIVVSGVNPPANKEVLKLVEKHPDILRASLGIYPIDALGKSEGETGLPRQIEPIDLKQEFSFLEKNKEKIVSIGEVGMDFHWATKEETYEKQAENFRKIIRFAMKIKKPIVIHSRNAERECVDILNEEIKNNEIKVVQHCFSGRKSVIKMASDAGHYFSIPPVIMKAQNFQVLVEMVPLTQLLTETDAPWLSPYKEKKNEPAYVIESIRKIAEIKKISVEETAEQVWKNYKEVFKD